MKRVAYWVCTGLVGFFIGSGGVAYAMQVPDVVQGVVALGFPVHFIVLLGVWKVLGSIAILAPGSPLIKEWAYAGIVFDLTGAASTSVATGGEWWHVAAPLSIAVLVAASWALRPESRRLPGATISGLQMWPDSEPTPTEAIGRPSPSLPAEKTRSAETGLSV
jgi:hypothetical protein